MKITIKEVRAWVQAAKSDGWAVEATYPPSESEERAAKGTRERFVFQMIARPGVYARPVNGSRDDASVTVWGPDGLQIAVPSVYSFDKIKAALRRCLGCGKESDGCERVGFAGRYCPVCIPSQRKVHEYPGWTN